VINTNNRNLNAFHERNTLHTCSASEAEGHEISSDFYAQGRPSLGLGHHQLIHKNCTQ